jgi:hypothetical protein
VKTAVAPAGRPEAVSVTGEVKVPISGCSVKLYVGVCPGLTDCVKAPLAVRVKFDTGFTVSIVAVEVLVVKLASPL